MRRAASGAYPPGPWHTSDDTVVPVQNSLAYYLALREHGWHVVSKQSFPFPRPVGRVFAYNEFVVVGERDPDA